MVVYAATCRWYGSLATITSPLTVYVADNIGVLVAVVGKSAQGTTYIHKEWGKGQNKAGKNKYNIYIRKCTCTSIVAHFWRTYIEHTP